MKLCNNKVGIQGKINRLYILYSNGPGSKLYTQNKCNIRKFCVQACNIMSYEVEKCFRLM